LSLVGAPKFAGGDLVSLDLGDGVGRGGIRAGAFQEIGNVKEHERHAHEAQAPFEPVPVPAHAIQHRHICTQ
jgi:hypothetical protein